MADPKKMCSKHLRGEYVECLMIAGMARKKRKLGGFFAHNCIEPSSVARRFSALKKEMLRRSYKAKKLLSQPDFSYLPKNQQRHRIDTKKNMCLLLSRCGECRRLHKKTRPPSL